jgi:hypothetical protein
MKRNGLARFKTAMSSKMRYSRKVPIAPSDAATSVHTTTHAISSQPDPLLATTTATETETAPRIIIPTTAE